MFYGWKPYVPVAQRKRKAEQAAKRMAKKGAPLAPVQLAGRTIAATFWGKSWCDNLERYSDYENRLPRGRAYVRNGSVIDLRIEAGQVRALVAGSSLYKTNITVAALPGKQWQDISADCAGSIDTLVELLQGRLSDAVMRRICQPANGLFPAPKELKFDCSCPDWADMCKHVAAVLYGVGARLDAQPELLFTLRKVDAQALVAGAGTGITLSQRKPGQAKAKGKALEASDAALADIFGIDIAETPGAAIPASPGEPPAPVRPKTRASKKPVLSKAKPAARERRSSKTPVETPVQTTAPRKAGARRAVPAKKRAAAKTASR